MKASRFDEEVLYSSPALVSTVQSARDQPRSRPHRGASAGYGGVVHTGRKTHRQYRTPVLVFRDGERIIIALTYGRESRWVRNVLAQGSCELQTQGRTLRLSRPRLFHDEHRRAMPRLVRLILRGLNVPDFLELTAAE